MNKTKLSKLVADQIPEDILEFEKQMEWDVPHLRASQARLAQAARKLNLKDDLLEKLMFPRRALTSSIPIRLDNGKIKIFAGYLVNHNDTLGPCQGQLRYHPRLSLGEITALAMSQTWKSALVGLPLGGAQGGVRCSPDQLNQIELERITRRYTTEMIPVIGPDHNVLSPGLGTDEQTMAWMMDTYSQIKGCAVRQVVTGKPRIIGGSIGRRDAPGRSVVYSLIETAEKLGFELNEEIHVAIQGFGKLGRSAFRKLSNMGCRIIAVNDLKGGVYNQKGLDYDELVKHAAENNGYVNGFKDGDEIGNEELLTLPCDVLIPAVTSGQITEKIANKIKARIIAEGANEATTLDADPILSDRGIFVIPDILANAGGVVVSYFEWVQGLQSFFWHEREVYHRLYRIIRDAFHRIYEISQREKVDMRLAALMAGVSKVADAMQHRGLYP